MSSLPCTAQHSRISRPVSTVISKNPLNKTKQASKQTNSTPLPSLFSSALLPSWQRVPERGMGELIRGWALAGPLTMTIWITGARQPRLPAGHTPPHTESAASGYCTCNATLKPLHTSHSCRGVALMSKPLDELKSVLAEDTRNFSDSSVSHWTSIMKEYELIQLGNAANGGKKKKQQQPSRGF